MVGFDTKWGKLIEETKKMNGSGVTMETKDLNNGKKLSTFL